MIQSAPSSTSHAATDWDTPAQPHRRRHRPWEHELTRALAAQPCGEDPAWYAQLALARINATSPDLLHVFAKLNAGKAYAAQVKPFNFMARGHQRPSLCRFAHRW
jgi:hypothetical protein